MNHFFDTMDYLIFFILNYIHNNVIIVHIMTLTWLTISIPSTFDNSYLINSNPLGSWFLQVKYYIKLVIFHPNIPYAWRHTLKKKGTWYTLFGDILYHYGYDGILLRCINSSKVGIIILDAYNSECRGHFSVLSIDKWILCIVYYYTTMENDYTNYVFMCRRCQEHVNLMHSHL